SVTYAKFEPSPARRRTASTIAGWAWPRITEPQPIVKSVNARPPVSQTVAPSPRASTTVRSRGRLYSPDEPAGKTAHERSAADVRSGGLRRGRRLARRDAQARHGDQGSLQSRERPQLLQTILHWRSSIRSPQRSQTCTHWVWAGTGARSARTRVGD